MHVSLKEIGLSPQSVTTFIDLIVSIIGHTYITKYWAQESSLWQWLKCSYELWKLWGKWLWPWFGFPNHLYWSHGSHPTGSGLVGINNCLRPIYLIMS